MKSGPARLTGGQGWWSTGIVSGFVLKLARQSAALTHARLAEVLDKLASSGTLTRAGRDQVAGLQYALRIADR